MTLNEFLIPVLTSLWQCTFQMIYGRPSSNLHVPASLHPRVAAIHAEGGDQSLIVRTKVPQVGRSLKGRFRGQSLDDRSIINSKWKVAISNPQRSSTWRNNGYRLKKCADLYGANSFTTAFGTARKSTIFRVLHPVHVLTHYFPKDPF
jgi:hypothetical protein